MENKITQDINLYNQFFDYLVNIKWERINKWFLWIFFLIWIVVIWIDILSIHFIYSQTHSLIWLILWWLPLLLLISILYSNDRWMYGLLTLHIILYWCGTLYYWGLYLSYNNQNLIPPLIISFSVFISLLAIIIYTKKFLHRWPILIKDIYCLDNTLVKTYDSVKKLWYYKRKYLISNIPRILEIENIFINDIKNNKLSDEELKSLKTEYIKLILKNTHKDWEDKFYKTLYIWWYAYVIILNDQLTYCKLETWLNYKQAEEICEKYNWNIEKIIEDIKYNSNYLNDYKYNKNDYVAMRNSCSKRIVNSDVIILWILIIFFMSITPMLFYFTDIFK